MAHNAGPLDKNTDPGELFPEVPGFVPEDFHIVREADGTWRKPADWPDWDNEWEVLNRNPFSWDIAQESPNVSFNPNGTAEGQTYPKWTGVRHPGRSEPYPDTDLVVATNAEGQPVHPFSNKEPFEDVGFIHPDTGVLIGAGNGRFDFLDLNGNGKHDAGEPSEPFEDTGVDSTVPWRRTTQWGYGDGRYNMGTIVPEDVNQMLFRAVRWFLDKSAADGFRLDAVKHVPAYFFGKQSGADRNSVNWGYNGQIQEQFNVTRGFNDWENHRDSVFAPDNSPLARNDAMLFGEHLGFPPAEHPYLDAGMRIANDNPLNEVRNTIGNNLTGYDHPNFGLWGAPNQVANYVMSHDNAWLWGGDRPLAHAHLLAREGLPIVYTDGYNEDPVFPEIARVPFLMWVYFTTDSESYPEGSGGVGKGNTQVVQGGWNFNGAHDGTGIPDWWSAMLPAMPEGTVLRYKVGFTRTQSAAPRFPFTGHDIDLAERTETVFEIDGFDAETVKYHVHNDYGTMATGLEEGFHVLRSRAFVGRGDGSSIFHTNTQVFYYDTRRTEGMVKFPAEGDTLGGGNYGAVVLTDPSVTEVWFNIEDLDSGNDGAAAGNGPGNWAQATRVLEPSQLGTSGYVQEWRFTYQNIPASGSAIIRVRLLEASSSRDMALSDEDGWFTTIERQVFTGSPLNFAIGFPTQDGELVDENYSMKIYFSKSLLPDEMNDGNFLDEFSISIASTTSGQPDNPVLQPRANYHLIRNPDWDDYSVEFTFRDLYNGDPDFLHHISVEHRRGSLTLGDTRLVRMRPSNIDSSGDGMPDWWKRMHGLDPYNPAGIHGRAGDFDGDGLTNWQEFVAGLIPNDPSDGHLFPKLGIAPQPDGSMRLDYPVLQGRRYRVWHTADMNTWQPLADWWWPWPDDTRHSVTDPAPANPDNPPPRRIYRLEIDMN